MNLHEFNILGKEKLKEELFKCCGSTSWVNRMLKFVPAEDFVELLEDAEEEWFKCSEEDWKEAFAAHPKIGDPASLAKKFGNTASWANEEQSGAKNASGDIIQSLAEENKNYEKKFGYIFITCATGKSGDEMLVEIRTRIQNTPEVEIQVAAEEQNKITKLRLEKLIQ